MRASRRTRCTTLLVTPAFLLLLASCGSSDSDGSQSEVTEATQPTTTEPAATTELTESATTSSTEAEDESEDDEAAGEETIFEAFDSAVFSNSTSVLNEWFPLTPGNRLVLDGFTLEEGETLDHRIEFIVTDLTKVIGGVETVVAWIEDYSDDELVEAELAFYAQDDDGNVWFFGEYPEEYEDGEFIEAPAWIHGIEEAKAGIKMYADPQLGTPPYYQGWGPAVEWSDFGKIDAVEQETCVELECFVDVLVIAESSLDEEEIFQLKSYAKGVGNIEVGWRGEADSKEELGAAEFGPVSAEELDEYRTLALEMEAHAYEVSPEVYGLTEPLK